MKDKVERKAAWPKDDKPVRFEELGWTITEAIRFAYRIDRINRDKDIPYDGLPIGKKERATCLEIEEALTSENLAYSEEDQGRDALVEIVDCAVRLGIEQGRRLYAEEHVQDELLVDAARLMIDKSMALRHRRENS